MNKLKGYITEMPLLEKPVDRIDFYLCISISNSVIDDETYSKVLKAFDEMTEITIIL